MAKRRFSELPAGLRAGIIGLGVVQVVLNVAAQVDITRRSREQLTGPKLMWRAISMINLFGPLAYFRRGRR